MPATPIKLGLKDAATLASAAAGVASIGLSLKGNLLVASVLIILAALLDYSDGLIARRLKTANEFGRELDAIADAVGFAAAPVALALSASNDLLTLAACMAYATAGVVRLARFNLQKDKKVFYGLPIPAAALGVVAVVLAFAPAAPAVLAGLAALMVSDYKITKLGA